MADKIIKSVIWLGGFGAIGYGLLVTLSANEDTLRKELPGIEKPSEALKKKQQFVNVLQAAANSNQPLYRLNKEGIDKEIKKE